MLSVFERLAHAGRMRIVMMVLQSWNECGSVAPLSSVEAYSGRWITAAYRTSVLVRHPPPTSTTAISQRSKDRRVAFKAAALADGTFPSRPTKTARPSGLTQHVLCQGPSRNSNAVLTYYIHTCTSLPTYRLHVLHGCMVQLHLYLSTWDKRHRTSHDPRVSNPRP
jgi:hypothetical protein